MYKLCFQLAIEYQDDYKIIIKRLINFSLILGAILMYIDSVWRQFSGILMTLACLHPAHLIKP